MNATTRKPVRKAVAAGSTGWREGDGTAPDQPPEATVKSSGKSTKKSTSATANAVVVKSLTVKTMAPASVPSGTGKNAGNVQQKAVQAAVKQVTSAAREVDSKATRSGSRSGKKPESTGAMDKIEKPVVLKVSEVATKTPKTTPDTQTLLTEEQILKMGEKDYMNEAQLAFFKARLQQLERDLLKNAGETTEHLRETVLVPDPADRATIEEEHALELRTRDRERKLLKKVQQSIVSIDAGEYGWCEETGEPIGIPRLLARPTATLSLEAQQRRELKQKLYGD